MRALRWHFILALKRQQSRMYSEVGPRVWVLVQQRRQVVDR
jgi:hypothetical protein